MKVKAVQAELLQVIYMSSLQVEDSEHFERETDDIVYHLEVGIAQAALGCRLKIPSIEDHEIDVEIPPGSQYGQRITIAGQGIPRLERCWTR